MLFKKVTYIKFTLKISLILSLFSCRTTYPDVDLLLQQVQQIQGVSRAILSSQYAQGATPTSINCLIQITVSKSRETIARNQIKMIQQNYNSQYDLCINVE